MRECHDDKAKKQQFSSPKQKQCVYSTKTILKNLNDPIRKAVITKMLRNMRCVEKVSRAKVYFLRQK